MRCYLIQAMLSCNDEYCQIRFHIKAVNEFDAAYYGMQKANRLAWCSYFSTKEPPKIYVHIERVEDVTEEDMEVCEDEKSDC